jgi:PIN domain nuclease of toxin-antitoxin system
MIHGLAAGYASDPLVAGYAGAGSGSGARDDRGSERPCGCESASLWEIAIKVNQGKLKVDFPRFCQRVAADGFSWPPIENAHILQFADLPVFNDHKDPFDRLLVAQALSEPLILLTADAKLARYGTTVRIV